MSKQATAVAKQEENANAVAVASAINFMADAGMGTEGADKDSFAVPFLSILQPLSPQVVDGKEGAKGGKFINSVTEEMNDEVLVVPVAFQRRFLRWQPREKGGGYKGDFSPIDVETGKVEGLQRGDDGRLYIGGTNPKEHDQLKDTRNHFVMLVRPDGSWTQALVSMSSTQIKKSKRWLSRIQGIQIKGPNGAHFTPPSFSHIYRCKSVKEQNDQGSWFGWDIDIEGQVQDAELYAAAKAFHANIVAGKVDIAPPVSDDAVEGDSEKF